MRDPANRAHRLHVVAALAAAAFAAGALAALFSADAGAESPEAPNVVAIEAGGFRYTYHVVTGDESLFDLRADPRELRDVLRTHTELARELRRALESKLHVENLGVLQRGKGDTIRALRSLGYL